MSNITDAAIRTLRIEATRLSGHASDRVFMAHQLDKLEAWMAELEYQHALRAANVARSLPESRQLADARRSNKAGT